MIIDKGFSQGDVISIKFIGGEEIICRYESEISNSEIKVSKPLAITLGQSGLGMIPWIFLADTDAEVKIKMHSVAAITKPKKDACDQYLQGTTGIALH